MNSLRSITLLIVEDDTSLRQMLSWELEERGYRITAVATCALGREALSRNDFDLALLDYCLPDGTGLDLLSSIHAKSPAMPVILCSALACPETRLTAISKGATVFLAKPTPIHVLDKLFRQALRAHAA